MIAARSAPTTLGLIVDPAPRYSVSLHRKI
jgi:hypothetical protein